MKATQFWMGLTGLLMWAGLSSAGLAEGPFGDVAGFCGKIVPIESDVEVVSTFQCSCAGKGQEWAGEVDFGAVSWSGSGGSSQSQLGLLCQTVQVHKGYDAAEPEGPFLIKPHKEVMDIGYIAKCSTSSCWSFLFISGSGASCAIREVVIGTHVHYGAVGVCPEPFETLGAQAGAGL